MEGTYRHVLEATDEVEAAAEAVSASGNNLACITSTLVFLMRLTGPAAGMSPDDVAMVQSALSPIVHDSQDQVSDKIRLYRLPFLHIFFKSK